MPRRQVEFRAGEFYHVYNRGVNRDPIFFDDDNYLFFLNKLREYIVPLVAECIAYCLMPNHYHLVLRLTRDDLASAMQIFGTSYTKSINKHMARVGPLYQSRFQAIHVDREEYLLHLTRYVHLNPYAAKLVRTPEAWEYSSYREYTGTREGTLPSTDTVLARFDDSFAAYRDFVEAGMDRDDELIKHLQID